MTGSDFAAQFKALGPTLPGARRRDLAAHRSAAMADFLRLGFPNRRVEEWKFTGTDPLARIGFQPSDEGREGLEALTENCALPGIETRIVLVNGRYRPELSQVRENVRFRFASLAQAIDDDAISVADLPSGPVGNRRDGAFHALNAALVRDGAVLHVLAGTRAGTVQIIHMADPGSEAVASHTGFVLKLEPGASMTLIETWSGVPGTHWSNVASRFLLGAGAHLMHIKLQDEPLDSFHTAANIVHLAATAHYTRLGLSLGCGIARDELDVRLEGEGAVADLNGIAIALHGQHIDHTLRVAHLAADCRSNQLYKHVADGDGHTVFQGRISVAVGAQKSDAQQLNNNLLLADDAEADTKPELEILADDVKCSHGATVGDLDANSLFYLMARGIGAREARHLLIEAFALAPLEAAPEGSVRDFLAEQLRQKLQATNHD